MNTCTCVLYIGNKNECMHLKRDHCLVNWIMKIPTSPVEVMYIWYLKERKKERKTDRQTPETMECTCTLHASCTCM